MPTAVKPKPIKTKAKDKADGSVSGGRRSWAEVIPGVVDDYAVPHLGTLVIALVSCQAVRFTDPATKWLTVVMTILGTLVILPWVAWRYAEARKPFQRAHAAMTPALVGLGSLGWQILTSLPKDNKLSIFEPLGNAPGWWVVTYLGLGTTLALTWNIRRAEVIRGDGEDGADKLAEALGLVTSSVDVIENTANRIRVRVQLANGQGFKDLAAAVPKLEAVSKAMRGAGRAIPGKRAHEGDVILIKRDVLKKPPKDPEKWNGRRRSFGDGFTVALSENGDPVPLRLAANPLGAASHMLVMGMSRSGKSHLFRLAALKLSRCNDVVLWVADTTKGAQTLAPVLPAVDWWAGKDGDRSEVTAMIAALRGGQGVLGIIRARGDYLGERGLDDWTPGCGLPALVVWIEEAAQIALSDPFIRLVETGLSVGVFVVTSLQRAMSDSMPVSARAQFASNVCFGVQDSADSAFVLRDQIQETAIAHEWRTKFPGKCYVDSMTLDDEMSGLPARTFGTKPDAIYKEIAQNAPGMSRLDSLSAEAAGPTYAGRTVYGAMTGTCPVDPKVAQVKRRTVPEQRVAQDYTWIGAQKTQVPSTQPKGAAAAAAQPTVRVTVPIEETDMEDDDLDPQERELDMQEEIDAIDQMDVDDPEAEDIAQLPEAYPGSDVEVAEVDARAELPEIEGDIVFEPLQTAVLELTGEARHAAWVETLAEVAADGEHQPDGSILVTTKQILDAWYDDPDEGRIRGITSRSRPWVHARIETLIEAGLCERLESTRGAGGRGRYLLSAHHDWAHPRIPVTDGEYEDGERTADNGNLSERRGGAETL